MQSTMSQPLIGDFVFDVPALKDNSIQFYSTDQPLRILWHTQPQTLPDPHNITLEWRRGLWPNVTDWRTIVSQYPNQNYYDWTMPDNLFAGVYVLRITTLQRQPAWIRDRYSDPFRLYIPMQPINGTYYISGGAKSASTSIWASVVAIVSAVLAV